MKKLLTLLLCIVLAASIFMFSACDKDKGGNNDEAVSYAKEDVEKLFEKIFTYVFKTDNSISTSFIYNGKGDEEQTLWEKGRTWEMAFGACYISKYNSVDYAKNALEAYKQKFDENKKTDGSGTKLEGLYFEQHGEYIVWGQHRSFFEKVQKTQPDLSGIPEKLKTEYKNCIAEILNNKLTNSYVGAYFEENGGIFTITYSNESENKTKEIIWLADENNTEAKSRYEESKKSPGTTDMGDNVLIITQAN